jgi:type I restriction enzyme R subunit
VSTEVSEKKLEEAIEEALTAKRTEPGTSGASGAREALLPYGVGVPGGFKKRSPEDYDRELCLIPQDVMDFVYATQPKMWERLKEFHGPEVKERFLRRLSQEIARVGSLEVLRKGVRDSGCKFDLAYFHPASGLNEELQKLYDANIFSVVRQVKYSERSEQSLDLVIFLNGLPVFTAELKNPLTGQTVEEAIKQYRFDRDPKEPLFAFSRCLAHFAMDPDLVYVTTHLQGAKTWFLPFNKGKFGGAGNLPVLEGYATAYLWEEIWARDSVLNLIQYFIQVVEEEDEDGRKTGEFRLIFPRFHQLESVRRLITEARTRGAGQRYLIQHSAGSGKSNSIAWLAHQLSVLHDPQDRRVFDSIVVVTDRLVLDRQLQATVRQFEQVLGVVENIDKTSRQLKEALELGKTIIVTTLQKFPVIVRQIDQLPGQRFAVIVDEAHSSQSGETSKNLKAVLASKSLEEAEKEDVTEAEDFEDKIVAEIKNRSFPKNLSFFAFTATPKSKTLELFGAKLPDGRYEAFSTYTMRQAIEENFILDVLENYTTYKTYWRLLKKVEDDPRYDRLKASYLLRAFVALSDHAIEKKVEIIVEHFAHHTAHQIGGLAKAMIVTRSRLHAVRTRLALDRYLREKGYPFKALVAFSGSVHDGGRDYTEAGMNSAGQDKTIGERQTAREFKKSENRFLVVANKFQTGFDQALLHTMYVDKKLGGVAAVQTLSRLNRVYPAKDKRETLVLDFANEAEDILEAFKPYYEKTLLSEGTDPNLLYNLQQELLAFHLYLDGEVEAFARVYFNPSSTQDRLYALLRPIVERFQESTPEEKVACLAKLKDYIRLYAFLSQVITFADPGLEKLYVFSRLLYRYLPSLKDDLPREVMQKVDMESFRIQQTGSGQLRMERGNHEIEPVGPKRIYPPVEDIELLSWIIRELNERFGTDFTEADRVFIQELESRLSGDQALTTSLRVNVRENARLTFDHVVNDRLQDMVDTNFKFYKRVTDDQDFSKYFLDWLFDRFWKNFHNPPSEAEK